MKEPTTHLSQRVGQVVHVVLVWPCLHIGLTSLYFFPLDTIVQEKLLKYIDKYGLNYS